MPEILSRHGGRLHRLTVSLLLLPGVAGCAAVGSVMSPYPEKFGCKNSDHGVCIHPETAYEDAVAGRTSRSDPAVTNDKRLLRSKGHEHSSATPVPSARAGRAALAPDAYAGYRDSLYRELQDLIEQPVTPMLKAPRTVRTLILPYADRQRPERLYMPRYVFSILDRPEWVVGDYLVAPIPAAAQAPVLGQVQEKVADDATMPAAAPEQRR
jgi:conjugal transfer pilus assembly protein TraV